MRSVFSSLILLLTAGIICTTSLHAQKAVCKKASYFRKTIELRNMPVVLPGERDRSWKNNLIENRHKETDFSKLNQDALPEGIDPILQDYQGSLKQRGPILNFDGIGNVNGVYPPDTDGDIGLNHYVQMINLSFAIWDREGNKLYGPVDNSTLWNGFIGPWTGTNDGDPIILYDEVADRWMMSQFAVHTTDGTFWELIAISESGDPLGAYYQYAFEFPVFNDYPKFGIWHDAYYASFNMFGDYRRVAAAAFERDAMIAGDPDARMILFDLPEGSEPWSMMPADADAIMPPTDTPNYFAYGKDDETNNEDAIEFWAFHTDWENPSNSSFTYDFSLPTEAFNPYLCEAPRTQCISQPETTTKLEALSTRLMYRLQYRNFGTHQSMVVNHTVNANGTGLAGIRWYEFRNDNNNEGWYIRQQSTYAPDDQNRWMGSIAMNGKGDIAIAYSVSGSESFPSLRYAGRSADAPLNTLNYEEIELASGKSSQSGINRWGDYSKISIDPTDDSTFWATNEYMRGGWKTRIASFNFLPPLAPWVNAGENAEICLNSPFITNASAGNIKEVIWTSSGDGNFTDKYSLNAKYLRGAQDIKNGRLTLYIEAAGYIQGQTSKDSLILEIINAPIISAGNDTLICANNTFETNATMENGDSVNWISSGDGYFDNPNSLITNYIPGSQDITNGKAYLSLFAYQKEGCKLFSKDRLKLSIDACTGIKQTTRQNELKITPNPASEQFTVKFLANKEEAYSLKIVNINGQEIFSENGKNFSSRNFKASLIPAGTYLVILKSGNKKHSKRLIIN